MIITHIRNYTLNSSFRLMPTKFVDSVIANARLNPRTHNAILAVVAKPKHNITPHRERKLRMILYPGRHSTAKRSNQLFQYEVLRNFVATTEFCKASFCLIRLAYAC